MEEVMIVLGGMAIFIAIIVLCFVAIISVINWLYDARENRRHKTHPQYFTLCEEINKAGKAASHYWCFEIKAREDEIKRILNNMIYLPAEKVAKAEEELEELRMDLFNARAGYHQYEMRLQELRDAKSEYMIKHNIVNWED